MVLKYNSVSARKLTQGPKWPWRLVLGANFFANVWSPDTGTKVRYEEPLSCQKNNANYYGIHDVVNDQEFAMHYWPISNTVSQLEVFWCERINTAKQKDGLISFLMLSVSEAKIFQYGFLEEQ